MRDRLARQGVSVRLHKVLGWGGNGVASLFEVWPGGADAPSNKVVVKSLLRRGLGMEMEWFWNLVRATPCFRWTDRRGLRRLMFLLLTATHCSRLSDGQGTSSKRAFGQRK